MYICPANDGGNGQSIDATAADAIVRRWLGSTAT